MIGTLALMMVTTAQPIRQAVIVGSNIATQERRALRHAHRDAELIADALIQAAMFAEGDITLLRDPDPSVVVAALDTARSRLMEGHGVLFFYYSGHADEQALYPNGKRLPLDELKKRLDDTGISVRIGVVDACRGGGWTLRKGDSPDTSQTSGVALDTFVGSEGSALIASSSGDESAHESDALEGSFFTHHFAAGLLGPADEQGDGEVTLTEAFRYAQKLTVRDTSRLAREIQHPSFSLHLTGRSDLVLSRPRTAGGGIALKQERGPLELLHLRSGATLLEVPSGPRTLMLAVPPGRYLVRRPAPDGNYTREITVTSGNTLALNETELERVGFDAVLVKGETLPPPVMAATPERGRVELRLLVGSEFGAWLRPGYHFGAYTSALDGYFGRNVGSLGTISAHWGITDRFTWAIGTGAFAYRFGTPETIEVVPWGGLTGFSATYDEVTAQVGAGIDARIHAPIFSSRDGAILGLRTTSFTRLWTTHAEHVADPPTTWALQGTAGVSLGLGEWGLLNFALQYGGAFLWDNRAPQNDLERGFKLGIGGVHTLGLRPLPFLQVFFSDSMTFDFNLGAVVMFRRNFSDVQTVAPNVGVGLTSTF